MSDCLVSSEIEGKLRLALLDPGKTGKTAASLCSQAIALHPLPQSWLAELSENCILQESFQTFQLYK